MLLQIPQQGTQLFLIYPILPSFRSIPTLGIFKFLNPTDLYKVGIFPQ